MPSVLVIDESLIARQGLRQILSQEFRNVLFAEAKGGKRALALLADRAWDLVILNIGRSKHDAFGLLTDIRKRQPSAHVLLMTAHADAVVAARAQQAGATGYFCKDASRSALLKVLRNGFLGQHHFDKDMLPQDPQNIAYLLRQLSAREYLVMLALAEGKRITDIALKLELSAKTVSTYKRRVFNKLQVNSIPGLIRQVSQAGTSDTTPSSDIGTWA
jgi:DNA-binding NarL/FixJ family response regulator